MERESASPPLTKFQILIKLVDEWKGENELQLRDLQRKYNNINNDKDNNINNDYTNDLNLFMKEGFLNVSISNCDFFIKLINMVNMRYPPPE